jgi:hypothetical protein
MIYGLSAIAAVFTLSAHAGTSILIDQEADGLQVTGIQYRVNPAMGRAWALVETYDSSVAGGDDGDPSGATPVHVAGLTYNAATGQVLFGETVCANVVSKPRKLLITSTGACGFHTVKGSHTMDDGFYTHVVRTVDVYFDVK